MHSYAWRLLAPWFQGRGRTDRGSGRSRRFCLLVRTSTDRRLPRRPRPSRGANSASALYDGLTVCRTACSFDRVKHASTWPLGQRRADNPHARPRPVQGHQRHSRPRSRRRRAAGVAGGVEVTRKGDSIARLERRVLHLAAASIEKGRRHGRLAGVELSRGTDHRPGPALRVRRQHRPCAFPRDGAARNSCCSTPTSPCTTRRLPRRVRHLRAPCRFAHSDRLALIGELRGALEREELVLYYQPATDLSTGSIMAVGPCSLASSSNGTHHARRVHPLVQETGLIKPLTHYVARPALRQCRCWMDSVVR